jgi:hypothetical protein
MASGTTTVRLGADHALHRIGRMGLGAGAVGLALSALGAFATPDQFLRSYLVAFLFLIGIALGCLAILMISYVTGGAWGAVTRRVLESGTRTLPFLAIAFLPIAIGLGELYAWARPETVAHDPLLQMKHIYLNRPFFLGRAVFYFTAWLLVAHFLNRWSVEMDETHDPAPGQRRLEQLSRGGIVLLGLTMTFASVDWMMSLEPHWFSTIYGILFIGGSVLTAMAVVIPVTALLVEEPSFAAIVTPTQFHDLGKLLLAFVMLWAYFGFSQFLITWSGNLPDEIPWYVSRLRGGWEWVALAIVVFHFALPFVVLLSRDVKRRPRALGLLALALVALRFVDLFWMVAPAFHPAQLMVHWLDAAALLGLGGLWLGVFVRELASRPLVQTNDPSLPVGA